MGLKNDLKCPQVRLWFCASAPLNFNYLTLSSDERWIGNLYKIWDILNHLLVNMYILLRFWRCVVKLYTNYDKNRQFWGFGCTDYAKKKGSLTLFLEHQVQG
jgi:hypothetical protein